MRININRILNGIPENHTSAIITNHKLYFSGNTEQCVKKWDSIPFESDHDIYTYIIKSVENKWYVHTWMQF
jgi:hypothetical protein